MRHFNSDRDVDPIHRGIKGYIRGIKGYILYNLSVSLLLIVRTLYGRLSFQGHVILKGFSVSRCSTVTLTEPSFVVAIESDCTVEEWIEPPYSLCLCADPFFFPSSGGEREEGAEGALGHGVRILGEVSALR